MQASCLMITWMWLLQSTSWLMLDWCINLMMILLTPLSHWCLVSWCFMIPQRAKLLGFLLQAYLKSLVAVSLPSTKGAKAFSTKKYGILWHIVPQDRKISIPRIEENWVPFSITLFSNHTLKDNDLWRPVCQLSDLRENVQARVFLLSEVCGFPQSAYICGLV